MRQKPETIRKITCYIARHWIDTYPRADIRGSFIPSGFVYATSAQAGYLNRQFYWDSYFGNIGLLLQGRTDLALGTIENLCSLLSRFGFVPNWNQEAGANRSQSPYLAHMVRDYFLATGDKAWLSGKLAAIESEYRFWLEKRRVVDGLSTFGHDATDVYLVSFYHDELVKRLGFPSERPEREKIEISGHYLSEAESCADFTSRFEGRCGDFLALDLNANLFGYERFFAWACCQIGRPEAAAEWMARSESRAERMRTLCWDEGAGWFFDYNWKDGRRAVQRCAIAFSLLWNGVATDAQAAAMVANLPALECDHGVASTEAAYRLPVAFQWDYPFGWPPHQYLAVHGLLRYGYESEAHRIAQNYLDLMIRHFEASGQLWEKYNVVDGSIDSAEYEVQEQMGWSAAVFLDFSRLLGYDCAVEFPY